MTEKGDVVQRGDGRVFLAHVAGAQRLRSLLSFRAFVPGPCNGVTLNEPIMVNMSGLEVTELRPRGQQTC